MDQRRALVTGGGRNLGREIALALADRGYDVAIVVRASRGEAEETAALVRERGAESLALTCDVGDEVQVEAAIASVVGVFGGIDAVVNGAAVRPHAALTELSLAEWNRVLATNLTGPYLVTKHALPFMLDREGGGSIINVSGIVAFTGGVGGSAHIAASKAGLLGLTRSIAQEYGGRGIRANAVVPNRIWSEKVAGLDPERLRAETDEIPLRYISTAREVAEVCAFLASPEARYVTGQTIHVNGGALMV